MLSLESYEREKLFKHTASGENDSGRSGGDHRPEIKDMIAALCPM